MNEKEIRDMMQRFYSLYCNCCSRDEKRIYLRISNAFLDLLDLKRLAKRE
jgi:hypothetical protein